MVERKKEPRISFDSELDEDESKEQLQRRGALKMDSSKSRFTKDSTHKQEFEERADAAVEQLQDKKQRAVELVRQFWTMVKDQTLEIHKGPIQKNVERENVSKLLQFASDVNNDINEPNEGAGSVAIISLLLKTVLHLRDSNNELQYKIAQAETKLGKLSSSLGKSDVK